MEYLKDSLDTRQIEDGFSNSKSIKGYRSLHSLPDPEQHGSSHNLLTQWDPGEKPLQPPLFRKESTSQLTAKTKGSDRIFTIKLGLSQSLMVQEGAHNPNITLKGYPKKFWSLFGQKANKTQQITPKTQQITLFHPKKRFILNPNIPRTDLQLKAVTPSGYSTKLFGLVRMVVLTAHATQQNSLIGSIPKIKFFHWLRQCHQYLGPYTITPNKILNPL